MIRDKEAHLGLPRLHTKSTKAEETHRVLKAVSSGCLLPQNMNTQRNIDGGGMFGTDHSHFFDSSKPDESFTQMD